ncbi:protein translocase subunit SecF [Galbitalea soli]|uniref:Protein-export membrane protein SecF n=1 Tax=Galbitalea soli TaxID=1268042 RepID=A0A7C9PLG5_9MICO|nr:protein translocase subunit SecF [Galbitalea soli]NEM90232.1 protein translocase subunit SecF [Galbitalea soli]NYJ30940.1 preprotein translocase subunit SecF [Galbitalea soli]
MASFSKFGNDLYTGARSFNIVGRRKIWFTIAFVFVAIAIIVPLVKGFNFGIEFRGGSEFTVSNVGSNPSTVPGTQAYNSVVPNSTPTVAIVGGNSVRVQTPQLTTAQTDQVTAALAKAYHVANPEKSITSSFIGASWGADITGQAVRALVVFLVLAALVMALYFRTWKMSVAALVALIHDLVITAGVYAILGFEVTPAAVIGFLTILGYSLYDTVVVFDKIRENTSEDVGSVRTFAETVNLAVNQTLVRSINTSVVALLPVGAILFIGALLLGAGTLRDISLALFVGILAGTYSTIFIAAPLYSKLREGEKDIKTHTTKTTVARTTSGAVR